MNYYVFLINRDVPKREELEFEEENRYEDLVFVSLKDTSKIKEYILKFKEKTSFDYFVYDNEIKSKNKLYSFNRYYAENISENNYIARRISEIENFTCSSIEYYRNEEKDIPNNNGKINIYSNKDYIYNNFLNIIKIQKNDILECYLKELDYDHDHRKEYFYYLFDDELYKIDLKKPYLSQESLISSRVNLLEKMDPNIIKHKIRGRKNILIYLINSDKVNINTNLNYIFVKVSNKREILLHISKTSSIFCFTIYFVIENNNNIYMKWKLMDFEYEKSIENIEDQININVYSNKNIVGYRTVIANSSLEAYHMEMHKNHYKRNGYFLYVKDNTITRLSLMNSCINEQIIQGKLEDIISETNLLDWV